MAVYMSVQEGGVLTARITGEIDHHSAGWLRMDIDTAINDRHPKVLRLDFSGVSFMDSSGVGQVQEHEAHRRQRGACEHARLYRKGDVACGNGQARMHSRKRDQ